ncbi:hypothetical protein FRZ67_03970 [Panacibacter ginsenosidivorans]|uniref:Lipoprotein n=1 Tax=Panacibacter ginsenosidivorans TaxID=1813871 RepID=A0A5B8V5L4_9BACT|nr:hypothetical protein [Panacibacter ginsenosidivorans]QEC66489.1 hypothetical protein FRZ67_03970 [Panacibacter ginsenosidivorans]
MKKNNLRKLICLPLLLLFSGCLGREMSKQNKFKKENNLHQSKGLQLTQTRLGLDGLINHRNATVEIIDKKDKDSQCSLFICILVYKGATQQAMPQVQ